MVISVQNTYLSKESKNTHGFLIDPPNAAQIINVAALIAKMGVSAGWASLITFTTESYPTVVR